MNREQMAANLNEMGWRPERNIGNWAGVVKDRRLIGRYTNGRIARSSDLDWVSDEVFLADNWPHDLRCGWHQIPGYILSDIYLKIMMEGL